MSFCKRTALAASVTATLVASTPVLAEQQFENSYRTQAAAADALIARPLGLVVTGLGAAVFVVSLPFSLIGGNVGEAADMLVVEPARETFGRCLGCTSVEQKRANPDAE